MDFQEFNKIARYRRPCIVTEKLDGSNAQVYLRKVDEVVESPYELARVVGPVPGATKEDPPVMAELALYAGSRNQFILPEKAKDNFGFAAWVKSHAEELAKLGAGRHFGEWWGQGIQRGYGLKEKRFSLFNVSRWGEESARPSCCSVVPVLAECLFSDSAEIEATVDRLRESGSVAAPGFMNPEGIIIFHLPSYGLFKRTLVKDDEHKSQSAK